MTILPVLIFMFPTTFLSARLVTAVIIAKSLVLTPVVVAKVLTVSKDALEVEMVVGAEEAGVTGCWTPIPV